MIVIATGSFDIGLPEIIDSGEVEVWEEERIEEDLTLPSPWSQDASPRSRPATSLQINS